MYSTQYSSGSFMSGNYYGPSASAISTPQQQQQQQQQYEWTGEKWVPREEENRVQKYTRLYHHYLQQANNSEPNAAAWHKYYSDLASRAANYFHQNPGALQAPPDMQLPPDVIPPAAAVQPTIQPVTTATKPIVMRPTQPAGTRKWKPKSTTTTTTAASNYYGRTDDENSSKKKRRTNESSDHYYGPASSASSSKSTSSNSKHLQDGFDASQTTLSNRRARFGSVKEQKKQTTAAKYMGGAMIGGGNRQTVLDETDYERMTVKGTCLVLEKQYLRLTAPPRPENVRPLHILQQHVKALEAKMESKADNDDDYLWLCSQFKAVRQDCTVQRIQTEFTVHVYETHARLALAHADRNEFNQCQTQLAILYPRVPKEARQQEKEFLAYRLLYHVCVVLEGHATTMELMPVVAAAAEHRKDDPMVRHAWQVRMACAADDYHALFRLYRECPTPSAERLMEAMLPIVRYRALQTIVKGYRPTNVSVEFVCQELGLGNSDGRDWLESCGCVLIKDELVTKETVLHESTLEKKQSLA